MNWMRRDEGLGASPNSPSSGSAALANLDEAVLVERTVVLDLGRMLFLGTDFELVDLLAVTVEAPAGLAFERNHDFGSLGVERNGRGRRTYAAHAIGMGPAPVEQKVFHL